ncbi:expressed protein [Phakopsora pachyrhizi]|uniref:Expressed protein n=1 Tax=Phakopsora pachyrhizi TaxID=170000 RepID=A0AAV0BLP5_PHAPC|nr:expressed protein [Phakopsora pachyrhizi]
MIRFKKKVYHKVLKVSILLQFIIGQFCLSSLISSFGARRGLKSPKSPLNQHSSAAWIEITNYPSTRAFSSLSEDPKLPIGESRFSSPRNIDNEPLIEYQNEKSTFLNSKEIFSQTENKDHEPVFEEKAYHQLGQKFGHSSSKAGFFDSENIDLQKYKTLLALWKKRVAEDAANNNLALEGFKSRTEPIKESSIIKSDDVNNIEADTSNVDLEVNVKQKSGKVGNQLYSGSLSLSKSERNFFQKLATSNIHDLDLSGLRKKSTKSKKIENKNLGMGLLVHEPKGQRIRTGTINGDKLFNRKILKADQARELLSDKSVRAMKAPAIEQNSLILSKNKFFTDKFKPNAINSNDLKLKSVNDFFLRNQIHYFKDVKQLSRAKKINKNTDQRGSVIIFLADDIESQLKKFFKVLKNNHKSDDIDKILHTYKTHFKKIEKFFGDKKNKNTFKINHSQDRLLTYKDDSASTFKKGAIHKNLDKERSSSPVFEFTIPNHILKSLESLWSRNDQVSKKFKLSLKNNLKNPNGELIYKLDEGLADDLKIHDINDQASFGPTLNSLNKKLIIGKENKPKMKAVDDIVGLKYNQRTSRSRNEKLLLPLSEILIDQNNFKKQSPKMLVNLELSKKISSKQRSNLIYNDREKLIEIEKDRILRGKTKTEDYGNLQKSLRRIMLDKKRLKTDASPKIRKKKGKVNSSENKIEASKLKENPSLIENQHNDALSSVSKAPAKDQINEEGKQLAQTQYKKPTSADSEKLETKINENNENPKKLLEEINTPAITNPEKNPNEEHENTGVINPFEIHKKPSTLPEPKKLNDITSKLLKPEIGKQISNSPSSPSPSSSSNFDVSNNRPPTETIIDTQTEGLMNHKVSFESKNQEVLRSKLKLSEQEKAKLKEKEFKAKEDRLKEASARLRRPDFESYEKSNTFKPGLNIGGRHYSFYLDVKKNPSEKIKSLKGLKQKQKNSKNSSKMDFKKTIMIKLIKERIIGPIKNLMSISLDKIRNMFKRIRIQTL